MRRFTMYRRNVPDATHNADQKNAPDAPQFEGVVFEDGTVAIRWRTAKRSTSFWDSMEDMLAIHGHPEYGSEIVWHDMDPAYVTEQDKGGYDPHGPEVRALHFWFADNGQQWKWHDDGCRSEQARGLLNHLAEAGFIVVPVPA
jgi:hypothetical protein